MKTPNGFILYAGPSLLDGSPIVAIATGLGRRSANSKTGDMVQTYIMRSDVHPYEASKTGQDESVCGDCKQRPANGGACYVTLMHGPSAVFRAFERGDYPLAQDAQAIAALGRRRMVRLGTYGDPAAVPAWVWEALVSKAVGRTGYTHQWANGALPVGQLDSLRGLVMASADTPSEAQDARAQGWRYFRIRLDSEALEAREFVCPASAEAGKRLDCFTCGACDGAQRGAQKASPVILPHGATARRYIALRSI